MLKIKSMQIVKQQEVNNVYTVDEIVKIKNITTILLQAKLHRIDMSANKKLCGKKMFTLNIFSYKKFI